MSGDITGFRPPHSEQGMLQLMKSIFSHYPSHTQLVWGGGFGCRFKRHILAMQLRSSSLTHRH